MMAKPITIDSLMSKLQSEISRISKMKPEEIDPGLFKLYLDKARTIAYLSQVASSIIEKHEFEKRLEEIERKLEAPPERK
ncbi:MAG TPA: hypothetical protein PLA64_13920 [Mesotoga infera]|nr:hypothetical protein [Mesotoga infera]